MKVSEIEIGDLYCFPKYRVIVSLYNDAKNDYHAERVFPIDKGTLFVALEAINVNDLYISKDKDTFKDKDMFRLRVLLATGEIGWLVLDNTHTYLMEKVSS